MMLPTVAAAKVWVLQFEYKYSYTLFQHWSEMYSKLVTWIFLLKSKLTLWYTCITNNTSQFNNLELNFFCSVSNQQST